MEPSMSEAAEARHVLVCAGERADELTALFGWAVRCFFEPRDIVSVIYARTETVQLMASSRVLHSDAPDWFPPALAAQLDGVGFAKKPRFLELITDLSPGDALVEFLERATVSQPDVVLLGTRGYTGLRRFLVGSTSSCVVESEAARSCLVVRRSLRHASCGAQQQPEEASADITTPAREQQQPEVEASADITTPARDHGRVVAIAVDGSSAGMALVLYCRQYLLRATDKVFVVHGRPDTPKTDDELTATDVAIAAVNASVAALHQMRDELLVAPCAALLAEGNVRDELVNWAESTDVDVLVVGSRGLGNALKRAVMGSVSSYAVQHAGCAVLVVSAPTLKALVHAEEAEAAAEPMPQQQETAEAH